MKTEQILNKLAELRAAGYERICLTELSHICKMTKSELEQSLSKAGLKLLRRRGMVYVLLTDLLKLEAQTVNFTSLSIRSPLLNDIN